MIRPTALGTAALATAALASAAGPDPTNQAAVFQNASALLAPWARTGGLDRFGGVAWLDYDNDNDLDLYLTSGAGSANGLFRNNGDGTFTDVTAQAGVASMTGNSGAVAADIDNDGYTDLFLSGDGYIFGTSHSQTRLYHNNGDGTFTDIAASAQVSGPAVSNSAAFGDINNDGYLDLFITSQGHLGVVNPPGIQFPDKLYLNNGDLTFTDITDQAGVPGGRGGCAVAFSDHDRDGWQDIFVAPCSSINPTPYPFHLYRNNHDNTFTDIAERAGLSVPGFWMAVAQADYNNDGHIDLFATNFGPSRLAYPLVEPHVLYRNNGDGTYSNVSTPELTINEWGWGATFADWNNDGWQDLFYAGSVPVLGIIGPLLGNRGHMFFNDGRGNLIERNSAHGLNLENVATSGLARADYDNDGFVDFVLNTAAHESFNPVTNLPLSGEGAPILMRNTGNANNWVTIRPRGTRSNSMGIGARIDLFSAHTRQAIEVQAGSSYVSSETPWPTFGLGTDRSATLRVSWPSGLVEWFNVRANRAVDITEGTGSANNRQSPSGK